MSYLHTLGLTAEPFPYFPDPNRWFSSRAARRAVEGIRDNFLHGHTDAVAVIGPKGVGKSTMCARICRDIAQTHAVICVVVPSHYQDGHIENLIFAACTGKVKHTGTVSRKVLYRQLLDHRRGTGSCVVFIDDAHHLPPGALIAVYSLLTLQKEKRSVVRIVMTGDHSLQQRLSLPPFSTPGKQTVPCILLEPLTAGETVSYIEDRLEKAGWKKDTAPFPFSPEALGTLVVDGKGLPGKINALCDQGLSSACVRERTCVHPEDLPQSRAHETQALNTRLLFGPYISTKLYRLLSLTLGTWIFLLRRRRMP